MYAIEVSNVSKKFRRESRSLIQSIRSFFFPCYVQVLQDISFKVEEREIFGLLGPNGAGKTTLIKILLGLIKPDKGEIRVLGEKIPDEIEKIKKRINAVFSRAGVYWGLTLKEYLEWFGKIYRVKDLNKKVQDLLKIFELEKRANYFADRCSTGELMRLNLARSLLNEPELLFLDEPTIGLDPSVALRVREFIEKLNEEFGTTIFLTTHYMEEADRLCKRVAIISKGKIIAVDSPKRLKSKLRKKDVVELDVKNFTSEVMERIKGIKGVLGITYIQRTEEIRLILEGLDVLDEVIRVLKDSRIKFSSIHTEEPSLEDVFLYLTGRELI